MPQLPPPVHRQTTDLEREFDDHKLGQGHIAALAELNRRHREESFRYESLGQGGVTLETDVRAQAQNLARLLREMGL